MASKQAAKGLPLRTGKRKAKFPRYFANTAARKLRHILKRNGAEAARAWKDLQFQKHRVPAEDIGMK